MYPVASRGDFFGGFGWWISFLIYTLSLIAVPMFIMISGYLLIDRTDSIKKNFERTIKRLVIPLTFWFTFYLIWKTTFRSVLFSASEIMNFIVSGNMFIYYFLVILIGLYLLLPIIQLIAKYGSKKLHLSILYGSFILTWFIGLTHYFSNLTGSITSLTTWWLPFFSYFWWGFIVKKEMLKKQSKFFQLFFSWILVIFFFGYAGFLLKAGNTTLAFKNGIFYWHDYLNPAIGLSSVGLFTWIISNKTLKKVTLKPIFNKTIITLASLSYGAYLIHMFVMDYIDIKHGFAIEFIGNNLISFIIIRPLITILASFSISFFISKIPYLRKIIGID